MSYEILGAALGQVVVLGGFFFWLSRRNTDRIDQIRIELAVMQNDVRNVSKDHDELIRLGSVINKCENDIHAAHEKIRSLSKKES